MAGLGILGGTFNPPHVGHLACAHCALSQLGLDRVVFVPVNTAPHKQAEEDPGPRHRLAMCRLLAEGDPRLLVSKVELRRGGPSYTADTLSAIHASDPRVELTFILGADIAQTLAGWHQPQEVLSLARLAIADRDGTGRQEVLDALHPLSPEARVSFLEMKPVAVSSSRVREMVAAEQSVTELVSPAVASYIARHGLYREPAGNGGPDEREGR